MFFLFASLLLLAAPFSVRYISYNINELSDFNHMGVFEMLREGKDAFEQDFIVISLQEAETRPLSFSDQTNPFKPTVGTTTIINKLQNLMAPHLYEKVGSRWNKLDAPWSHGRSGITVWKKIKNFDAAEIKSVRKGMFTPKEHNSEKGIFGVSIVVESYGRICFLGGHYPAGDKPEKRRQFIEKGWKELSKPDAVCEDSTVIFSGGDFNFRSEAQEPKSEKDKKQKSVPHKLLKKNPVPNDVENWRERFLVKDELIGTKPWTGGENTITWWNKKLSAWTWVDTIPKDKDSIPVPSYSTVKKENCGLAKKHKMEWTEIPTSGKGVCKNNAATFANFRPMSWTDRVVVGYAKTLHLKPLLFGRGCKPGRAGFCIEWKTFSNIGASDHFPVMAKVTIEIERKQRRKAILVPKNVPPTPFAL